MKLHHVFSLIFLFSSNVALSADFTSADDLFTRRGEGGTAIDNAYAAYKNLFPLTGADLVYAVDKMSRLDAYQGNLLEETQAPVREQIFKRCMDNVAQIPGTPEYYYWHPTCTTFYAHAVGDTASLQLSGQIFDDLNKGVAFDPTFEGGGNYRMEGLLYTRLPAFNPFGPTRDLQKAKTLLEKAVASPAYTHSPNPATDTGDYFYTVYYYYAQTLDALGQRSLAIQTCQNAIDNYNGGYVAPDKIPETDLIIGLIKDYLASLQTK